MSDVKRPPETIRFKATLNEYVQWSMDWRDYALKLERQLAERGTFNEGIEAAAVAYQSMDMNFLFLASGNDVAARLRALKRPELTPAKYPSMKPRSCICCGHRPHKAGRCGTTQHIDRTLLCECIADLDDRVPTPAEAAPPSKPGEYAKQVARAISEKVDAEDGYWTDEIEDAIQRERDTISRLESEIGRLKAVFLEEQSGSEPPAEPASGSGELQLVTDVLVQSLQEENRKLREAISPGRYNVSVDHYCAVARRMREKELRIVPLDARDPAPPAASVAAELWATWQAIIKMDSVNPPWALQERMINAIAAVEVALPVAAEKEAKRGER